MAVDLNLKMGVGKTLYELYLKLKRTGVPAWPTADEFYEWALAQGYREGCRLMRPDTKKPLSPDNFYLKETDGNTKARKSADWGDSIQRWNATVKQLRAAFGLPPLKDLEVKK